MAAPGNVEHKLKLLFDTKLDEKSKQQVGKQIKGMLENAVISFDEAEAKHNVESIIRMINRLFAKAEMEGLDTEKLLKMPSQQALQEIANRTTEDFQRAFDQALKKSGGIKIDFGNVDLSAMTEPLNRVAQELSDIGERITDTTKKSMSEIEASFKALKTDKKIGKAAQDIEKTLTQIDKKKIKVPDKIQEAISSLTTLRSDLTQSKANDDPWEKQYQYLLKYVHAYEAAQKQFGENLIANNPELKDLYEILSPKAKTVRISLENFVDVARGNELAEDKHKPWAREKTLQEIKQTLKNGIAVKGESGGSSVGDQSNGGSSGGDNAPPKPKSEIPPKPKKQADPVNVAIKGFIQQYTDMFDKLAEAPITSQGLQKLREDMFANLLQSFNLKDDFDEDELFSEFRTYERDFDEKRLGTYLKRRIESVAGTALVADTEAKTAPKEKASADSKVPSSTVAIDEAALEGVLGRVTYKVKIEGEENKDAPEDNQIIQALGEISQKIDTVSKDETLQGIKTTVETAFARKGAPADGKLPPEVKAETSSNRETRFERLSDIASMYEEVDDAEAAIKEFGELYKEIILIGDEATKTIKPNKSGINTLKKIANGDIDLGYDYSWVEFKRANPIEASEGSTSNASKASIDEASLESVLSRVVYNVKVEGLEGNDSSEDNKVAIDTEDLKSVLNAITYNVKVVQDVDAPDSEKPNQIDTEALKSVLNAITYNVKIAYDDVDKTANKITLDEAVLESTLTRVFANILNPQTPQNDGNALEPWAREDTLTAVWGALENIQTNTSKIGTAEAQQTVTIDANSISTISGDLTAIKTAVEAINSKVVKGMASSTQSGATIRGRSGKKNMTTDNVSEKKNYL